MGKKSKSSGKHYVSKGERPNVNAETLKGVRRSRTEADRMINKVNAWLKGKKTVITLENTETKGSNHRFRRLEGKVVWGDPNWKPDPKKKREQQKQEFVENG